MVCGHALAFDWQKLAVPGESGLLLELSGTDVALVAGLSGDGSGQSGVVQCHALWTHLRPGGETVGDVNRSLPPAVDRQVHVANRRSLVRRPADGGIALNEAPIEGPTSHSVHG